MNTVLAAILACSIVLIQCLTGGTRLVFSLPAYGLLAVGAILTVFRGPRRDALPRLECLLVSVLFFAYILGRAAFSPVGYLWWTDFYMVLACLVAYFLTAYYITDSRSRTIVLVALFSLVVFEVLVGLRQFTVGDNWMPFGFLKGGAPTRRASGTLISSIHLAGYLEAVGVFALSFALWSTWKTWARILSGYIGALCYVGVAITGSRGGYLSVVGSFIAFAVLSLYAVRKVRPRRFGLALAATVALVVLSLVGGITMMNQSPTLRHRVDLLWKQFEPKGQKDVRIYNWQAALDQFRGEPVWGTGAGSHLYYARLYRRPQIQADPIHAHSDYLELIAEYGLVGGVGMAVFLFFHIQSGMRGLKWTVENEMRDLDIWEPARNNSLALYIGALSAIAAYLVHSVMDFNLHIPGNALLFAFIFGVIISPARPPQGSKTAGTANLLRWVLPALGLWICVVGLPKFPGEYWTDQTRIAVRDNRFADATKLGQKALGYEKGNPELYFHLGNAYRGLGLLGPNARAKRPQFESAVDAYQKALAIFPYDSHTTIRLAQTLDDLGRFKEGGEAYQSAIKLDPNLSDVYAYYASHLASLGREAEAEEYFAKAKSLAQKDLSPIIRGTFLDPQNHN
ncbi:O-antigen ligase family protein [Verrucomicrobiota bacterium sgz303538]